MQQNITQLENSYEEEYLNEINNKFSRNANKATPSPRAKKWCEAKDIEVSLTKYGNSTRIKDKNKWMSIKSVLPDESFTWGQKKTMEESYLEVFSTDYTNDKDIMARNCSSKMYDCMSRTFYKDDYQHENYHDIHQTKRDYKDFRNTESPKWLQKDDNDFQLQNEKDQENGFLRKSDQRNLNTPVYKKMKSCDNKPAKKDETVDIINLNNLTDFSNFNNLVNNRMLFNVTTNSIKSAKERKVSRVEFEEGSCCDSISEFELPKDVSVENQCDSDHNFVDGEKNSYNIILGDDCFDSDKRSCDQEHADEQIVNEFKMSVEDQAKAIEVKDNHEEAEEDIMSRLDFNIDNENNENGHSRGVCQADKKEDRKNKSSEDKNSLRIEQSNNTILQKSKFIDIEDNNETKLEQTEMYSVSIVPTCQTEPYNNLNGLFSNTISSNTNNTLVNNINRNLDKENKENQQKSERNFNPKNNGPYIDFSNYKSQVSNNRNSEIEKFFEGNRANDSDKKNNDTFNPEHHHHLHQKRLEHKLKNTKQIKVSPIKPIPTKTFENPTNTISNNNINKFSEKTNQTATTISNPTTDNRRFTNRIVPQVEVTCQINKKQKQPNLNTANLDRKGGVDFFLSNKLNTANPNTTTTQNKEPTFDPSVNQDKDKYRSRLLTLLGFDQKMSMKIQAMKDRSQRYSQKKQLDQSQSGIASTNYTSFSNDKDCGFQSEYDIQRKLGFGQTSLVRLIQRKADKKLFAMKTIKADHLKSYTEREIKILSILNQPNLLKLEKTMKSKSYTHLITEYFNGHTLGNFASQFPQNRVPENHVRHIIKQIACGMIYCHKRGISHRDLKPDNILIDKDKNIKIIDFGYAIQVEDGTKVKSECGSPNYMAPEIIRRLNYDPKAADVWALGVVIYKLVTGGQPFSGRNDQELAKAIVSCKFEPIYPKKGSLNMLLESIFQREADKRPTLKDIMKNEWTTLF